MFFPPSQLRVGIEIYSSKNCVVNRYLLRYFVSSEHTAQPLLVFGNAVLGEFVIQPITYAICLPLITS